MPRIKGIKSKEEGLLYARIFNLYTLCANKYVSISKDKVGEYTVYFYISPGTLRKLNLLHPPYKIERKSPIMEKYIEEAEEYIEENESSEKPEAWSNQQLEETG